ncbi:hypothetical protein OE88DRAFT_1812346 [Heliocybe sulcata]|uniref:Uncharacterized protein n=1 Tax=Heliocybe sulcata TaxID=5364 RepID=A0A5C3MJW5_9AGAM|nr:hypothetical protein OE88DRAFT_1812346 [Heliocybe sulcata]
MSRTQVLPPAHHPALGDLSYSDTGESTHSDGRYSSSSVSERSSQHAQSSRLAQLGYRPPTPPIPSQRDTEEYSDSYGPSRSVFSVFPQHEQQQTQRPPGSVPVGSLSPLQGFQDQASWSPSSPGIIHREPGYYGQQHGQQVYPTPYTSLAGSSALPVVPQPQTYQGSMVYSPGGVVHQR